MHAAIASSSISPYMWIVSGPRSRVPLCGEGIDARVTRATFCPAGRTPALDENFYGRLVGAALLDQLDREVQVDVVPRRQRHRIAGVEARADQLLGAPVLHALDLRLGDDVYLSRSHVPGIRCEAACGSPPEGGSQPIRRATLKASACESRPSSRSVTPWCVQSSTLPVIFTVRWRNSPLALK